jgi:acyl-CoA reductase-like NAD-dependent aldehyde dehydrogenase
VADAVQRLWAAVPVASRVRYLRRAAQATLDTRDAVALLLATAVGRPRTEALLGEVLPSVAGLNALAAEGPRFLAQRRVGRTPALRLGRRAVLLQAPRGDVEVRAGTESPWQAPVLEVGAALLAGNAVRIAAAAPEVAERIVATFLRAGVPGELLVVEPSAGASAAQPEKGTMVVLDGAPVDRAVEGALWAAFAAGGRHPSAVGRAVVVPAVAEAFVARLVDGAQALRTGDPTDPATDAGPVDDADGIEAALRDAEARGATRLCGGATGPRTFEPAVVRGAAEPIPGPVLAISEAADDADAVAHVAASRAPVSLWTGDRARGERIARSIVAPVVWVDEHGFAPEAPSVRLARHVTPRLVASQPARLRSARWPPYDPALVGARAAAARLLQGRESERWEALREGAGPLARTALRLALSARNGRGRTR